MSALRELIAFFGVEVEDKKLDRAGEKMEGLAKLAEKAGATIGLAFGIHEIGEFITSQIEAGAASMHTAEMLGVAVAELKEFRYAAGIAGVSAEEADTALRFLNKNLGEAASGAGTAGQTFSKLGVAIKNQDGTTRSAVDVLEDVADSFAKTEDPAKATATAMELFGRAGARLIPLLNKGSKGIAELRKEFVELTGGAAGPSAEVLEEGEHALKRYEVASKGLKAIVAAELIPAFSSFLSWVTDLAVKFREFAANSYIVESALLTLGVVVAGLAAVWAFMNIEILLVVAALALIILVVDDIYTAFKGGKSVIGDFIDSIFGIGATKTVFDQLKFWANEAYDLILQIGNGIQIAMNAAAKLTNEVMHALKSSSKEEDARYARVSAELDQDLSKLRDRYDELRAPGVEAGFDANLTAGTGTRITREAKGFTFGQDLPFSLPPEVARPSGAVSTPNGASVTHGDVTQHNQISVNVQGGQNARETGKDIGHGIAEGLDDENQAAFAAFGAGGGH